MNQPQPVEPLPGDPLGKRLCQTFPYLWKAIVKVNDIDSPWRTLNDYPLRPRELWQLWQDAAQIVGVRFGSTTRYSMIDLDVKGAYHPAQNAQALSTIRTALETIGMTRTFLTQSSSSGGLHLWLPLPEPMPTFWLAATIRQCLESQGLIVKQGQLEIFPNCKAYGRKGEFTEYQGHRLPLQPASGSQLLDDDFNPIQGRLERFFDTWDQCAAGQDTNQLRQAIARTQKHWKKRSIRRASVSVESWRTALELEIREGWIDHGQTNHLLKQIACYGVVFQGLQGDRLVEYVQQTAMNCPGYRQWCRHQHEIALRCKVWARSAEKYYWSLGTEEKRQGNIHTTKIEKAIEPVSSINQIRAEDAQSRIKTAFNQLKETGQLILYKTKTALENAIIQLARCSKQTTRKYIHLWYVETDRNEVCTCQNEPVLERSEPTLANSQKSLESLPAKEVHTQAYMKGFLPVASSKSNSPLSTRGGTGGISTALENDIPQNIQPSRKGFPRFTSSIAPKIAFRSIVKQPGSVSAIPARKNQDDLRYEFGRLVNQIGWSLDQTKQFIQQTLGKTPQTLIEEDWISLIYYIRSCID